jgi:hypothetical protein
LQSNFIASLSFQSSKAQEVRLVVWNVGPYNFRALYLIWIFLSYLRLKNFLCVFLFCWSYVLAESSFVSLVDSEEPTSSNWTWELKFVKFTRHRRKSYTKFFVQPISRTSNIRYKHRSHTSPKSCKATLSLRSHSNPPRRRKCASSFGMWARTTSALCILFGVPWIGCTSKLLCVFLLVL